MPKLYQTYHFHELPTLYQGYALVNLESDESIRWEHRIQIRYRAKKAVATALYLLGNQAQGIPKSIEDYEDQLMFESKSVRFSAATIETMQRAMTSFANQTVDTRIRNPVAQCILAHRDNYQPLLTMLLSIVKRVPDKLVWDMAGNLMEAAGDVNQAMYDTMQGDETLTRLAETLGPVFDREGTPRTLTPTDLEAYRYLYLS